jgi:hypothetical protein
MRRFSVSHFPAMWLTLRRRVAADCAYFYVSGIEFDAEQSREFGAQPFRSMDVIYDRLVTYGFLRTALEFDD